MFLAHFQIYFVIIYSLFLLTQTLKFYFLFTYPTSNTEEAEVERFYEDLQDLLELTPKKDVRFIIGDWNAKVGSQEISGVTRQVWPWNTK